MPLSVIQTVEQSGLNDVVLGETPLFSSFFEEGDADIFASRYETPLGEWVFEAINGHVFDRVGSEALYVKTFGQEWYKADNKLLVILGCDGGLMLPYLQGLALGKGCKFIVVELPEVLAWIDDNLEYDRDLIKLIPADGDLSILHTDEFNSYLYRNSVDIYRCMATLDQFHPAYARFWTEYEQLLNRFFFSHIIEIHGSSAFINAQMINLADNHYSIHHLHHQFDGGVCVVLAGGPSLDDAIDWVKAHRQQVTLFAVGRVSARLLKEGIEPDFICAVDPNEISFDNSKHLLKHYKKSVFLHAFHVNPRLLSQWRGKAFYHGRRYPWIAKEPEADQQFAAPGPTVTNTLLSFITHLGFETVVFAGVDLCFKSDGQSHESGSIETQVGRFVHQSSQFIKTNSGEMAPTSSDFFAAQQVLSAQVESIGIHFPRIKFYNPSPNAAFVEGVDYQPWSDLVLPEWHNDALQRVDSVIAELSTDRTKFLQASTKEVARMRGKLVKVIEQAKSGLKANEKLFESSEAIPRRTKQVTKAREGMDRQLKDNMPLLLDYAPTNFHDALLSDVDHEQSKDDIQLSLKRYFTAIQASSSELLKLLEYALEILKLRQLERDQKVLTIELVNSWIRFGQPGRLYVWLDTCGRTVEDFSEEEQALAHPLIRAYDAIFKVVETCIAKRFKTSVHENTLESVLKAMAEVNESNIAQLQEVLAYCEEHAKEDDFYRDMGIYILGYFNKLREQPEDVYPLWSMITHPKLRQIVYKDHLSLALAQNKYEEALLVLQKLCVVNAKYLTSYASVLLTLNQPELAIETLSVYLKDESKDIAARLQLSRLLLDAGRMSEAKEILEEAYRQSPTNPIVQRLLIQSGGRVLAELSSVL